MNLHRAFWSSFCLFLLMQGCHKHAQMVTFVVPPSLQQSYVYAESGSTIEWYSDQALGQAGIPFTVSTNLPCLDQTKLSSDGKHPAVCVLEKGKTGAYLISFFPGQVKPGNLGVGSGATVMRVGPCTGCTGFPGAGGGPATQGISRAGSVILDCDSDKGRATPSSLLVNAGDQIYWTYAAGSYPPPDKDPFVVELDPGVCSNHSTGAKIVSSSDFCTAAKSTSYSFTVYGCKNPGEATITVP